MSSSTVKTPLSREEQAEVRKYLGYLDSERAAALALGIPTVSQPLFIVDVQLRKVSNDAAGIVREYLEDLRCIDAQIRQSRRRLKFRSVKGIEFANAAETDGLWEEYKRACMRLSDIIGAPINPYSRLHQEIGTVQMLTIRPT